MGIAVCVARKTVTTLDGKKGTQTAVPCQFANVLPCRKLTKLTQRSLTSLLLIPVSSRTGAHAPRDDAPQSPEAGPRFVSKRGLYQAFLGARSLRHLRVAEGRVSWIPIDLFCPGQTIFIRCVHRLLVSCLEVGLFALCFILESRLPCPAEMQTAAPVRSYCVPWRRITRYVFAKCSDKNYLITAVVRVLMCIGRIPSPYPHAVPTDRPMDPTLQKPRTAYLINDTAGVTPCGNVNNIR